MIDINVSLDLMEFVETQILPRYANFDQAHRLNHVNHVIKQSLALARKIGADINMAYVIAAYHDLGLEQMKIMKEAVEDHRASASHAPRSIYGKIVAEADRELEPDTVFRRTILYGRDHYPEMSMEQQWDRFTEHLDNKYSNTGYIKLWIPGSENEKNLKVIRDYINNRTALRALFDKIFNELNGNEAEQ